MDRLRRKLSLIGLSLLLFQAAGFAVSPIAVCCATRAQAADADDDCCKGLAPGQMCPLHHHRQPPSGDSHHDDGGGSPALRCGCSTVDPALVSLGFGLGVMPPHISLDVMPLSKDVARTAVATLDQPAFIESPPPRR